MTTIFDRIRAKEFSLESPNWSLFTGKLKTAMRKEWEKERERRVKAFRSALEAEFANDSWSELTLDTLYRKAINHGDGTLTAAAEEYEELCCLINLAR